MQLAIFHVSRRNSPKICVYSSHHLLPYVALLRGHRQASYATSSLSTHWNHCCTLIYQYKSYGSSPFARRPTRISISLIFFAHSHHQVDSGVDAIIFVLRKSCEQVSSVLSLPATTGIPTPPYRVYLPLITELLRMNALVRIYVHMSREYRRRYMFCVRFSRLKQCPRLSFFFRSSMKRKSPPLYVSCLPLKIRLLVPFFRACNCRKYRRRFVFCGFLP